MYVKGPRNYHTDNYIVPSITSVFTLNLFKIFKTVPSFDYYFIFSIAWKSQILYT